MPKRTIAGHIAYVVNNLLQKTGVAITRLPERHTYERQVQTVLKRFDVQLLIDVGAHYGEFATSMRELGYKGRILSFEPSAEAFERVSKAAARDSLWKVHRMCLGDEDGEVEIKRFHDTRFNSLHAPTEFALTGVFSENMEDAGTETVPIRRLDTLFPELGIGNLNVYLKIDTQGHDVQVLRGAQGVLSQLSVVQAELSTLRLYQSVPRMEEAITIFQSFGLMPFAFYPITFDSDKFTVMEWDCLFSRMPDSLRAKI